MNDKARALPVVQVFSRPGCHLCEELLEQLMPLIRDRATVEVHNIDTRQDWSDEMGNRIPVVRIGGNDICQYHLDTDAVTRALNAVPELNSAS